MNKFIFISFFDSGLKNCEKYVLNKAYSSVIKIY